MYGTAVQSWEWSKITDGYKRTTTSIPTLLDHEDNLFPEGFGFVEHVTESDLSTEMSSNISINIALDSTEQDDSEDPV